jgi:hypothetical protein
MIAPLSKYLIATLWNRLFSTFSLSPNSSNVAFSTNLPSPNRHSVPFLPEILFPPIDSVVRCCEYSSFHLSLRSLLPKARAQSFWVDLVLFVLLAQLWEFFYSLEGPPGRQSKGTLKCPGSIQGVNE